MHNVVKIWRVIDIVIESEKALKAKHIQKARLNAELLLADTLKTKRIDLYINFDKPLTESELNEFKEKLKRRLAFEPLQYILGYTEFYGYKFLIKSGVLIPRPETELLVEHCISILKNSHINQPKILEIGTGSGCISISISKSFECRIDAIDILPDSIKLAEQNSILLGTSQKINFHLRNFYNNDINLKDYDLIISNPPYIPLKEFDDLPQEIRLFEPKVALTDEKDGLEFYKFIFSLIQEKNITNPILLEIGDGKQKNISSLLKKYQIKNFCFHKDYNQIARVLEINNCLSNNYDSTYSESN